VQLLVDLLRRVEHVGGKRADAGDAAEPHASPWRKAILIYS
jgi:hypothetical protein